MKGGESWLSRTCFQGRSYTIPILYHSLNDGRVCEAVHNTSPNTATFGGILTQRRIHWRVLALRSRLSW